jgi:hypothetical protein
MVQITHMVQSGATFYITEKKEEEREINVMGEKCECVSTYILWYK